MSATASQLDDRTVRLVRLLPGSPEQTWRYLVESTRLATWMEGGSIDPRLGGGVTLALPTSPSSSERVLVRAKITRWDPPRMLEFAWKDRQVGAGRVSILLEGEGEETRLTLTQTRDSPGSGAASIALWSTALAGLTAALAASTDSTRIGSSGAGTTTSTSGASTVYAGRELARVAWWRSSVTLVVVGVLLAAGVGGALVIPKVLSGLHSSSPSCSYGSNAGGANYTGWFATNATCPPAPNNGVPAFVYVGSIACPYCAASSWAIYGAVVNFSTSHSGQVWGTSDPNDVYPDTPEVDLDHFNASGPYLDWQGFVGTDPDQVEIPSLPSPVSNYFTSVDPEGAIPFVLIGGEFAHTDTLVPPADLQSTSGLPITPEQVNANLTDYSTCYPYGSSVCESILGAQFWMEAYLWKMDAMMGITAPAAVTSNPYVAYEYDHVV